MFIWRVFESCWLFLCQCRVLSWDYDAPDAANTLRIFCMPHPCAMLKLNHAISARSYAYLQSRVRFPARLANCAFVLGANYYWRGFSQSPSRFTIYISAE
eukprot:TRINITY_DN4741_c0_g1_i3.p1 TRINITY_DN4741_c0_g1~~TRINITY_DN4741_c0_g1_i3.p1  ORF type:complete len:100 (-),score=2.29 TRINITY_DN4741_c0_g1_i3:261-560(-)